MTPSPTDAAAVLRHHAKTFFWAWLFLPRARRAAVADLYAFCRFVDDVADEGGDPAELRRLRARVADGAEPTLTHLEALGVRRRWLLDLVDGALSDVDFARPADEAALDLYCYRVAGVVGLMMCPLIGVVDERAHQHAVDLGCAMQLTNIARDVAEDLGRGRVYVPEAWGDPRQPLVVARLLAKAEGLYQSGGVGLSFIPGRARVSIKLARALYREIGVRLALAGHDPFRGRVFVPWWRKAWLTLKTLIGRGGSGAQETSVHNRVWLGPVGQRDDRDGRVLDPA